MKTIILCLLITGTIIAQDSQELAQAVIDLEPKEVLRLLKDGEDPNVLVFKKPAIIHVSGYVSPVADEILHYLIQYNAKLDYTNQYGVKLFITNLIVLRHKAAVFEAIQKGVKLNVTGESITPPIVAAALWQKDGCQVIKAMLEKNADPNLQSDGTKISALQNAIMIRDSSIVRLLIEHKADVNIRNADAETALMLSAGEGFDEIVKMLLDAGADPNLISKENKSALMYAAGNGRKGSVQLLLEKGARKDLKDSSGNTALKLAEKNKHKDIATLLRKSKIHKTAK
jgi:ankyrin repeat protein